LHDKKPHFVHTKRGFLLRITSGAPLHPLVFAHSFCPCVGTVTAATYDDGGVRCCILFRPNVAHSSCAIW